MGILTITELMRLTRVELAGLATRMANKAMLYPEGSPKRACALINLRNIRYVLTRRDLTP
jgi:hypothetical protein